MSGCVAPLAGLTEVPVGEPPLVGPVEGEVFPPLGFVRGVQLQGGPAGLGELDWPVPAAAPGVLSADPGVLGCPCVRAPLAERVDVGAHPRVRQRFPGLGQEPGLVVDVWGACHGTGNVRHGDADKIDRGAWVSRRGEEGT